MYRDNYINYTYVVFIGAIYQELLCQTDGIHDCGIKNLFVEKEKEKEKSKL